MTLGARSNPADKKAKTPEELRLGGDGRLLELMKSAPCFPAYETVQIFAEKAQPEGKLGQSFEETLAEALDRQIAQRRAWRDNQARKYGLEICP
jgi:hypothetical protein